MTLKETLLTLDEMVRQGKARHIGLSNYLSWQAATALAPQERVGLEKYATQRCTALGGPGPCEASRMRSIATCDPRAVCAPLVGHRDALAHLAHVLQRPGQLLHRADLLLQNCFP